MEPRRAARAGMPARFTTRQVDRLAFLTAAGLSLLATTSAAANDVAVGVEASASRPTYRIALPRPSWPALRPP